MMRVRAVLGPSTLHGIGLFAAEGIPEGTVVWEFDSAFDLAFNRTDVASLPDFVGRRVLDLAYWDRELQKLVLCGDDARFFNHSDTPNCRDRMPCQTVATRDIAEGEELTADYREWSEEGVLGGVFTRQKES